MLNNTGDIQAWYHGVRAIAARNCQVSQGNSINDLPENKQNLKWCLEGWNYPQALLQIERNIKRRGMILFLRIYVRDLGWYFGGIFTSSTKQNTISFNTKPFLIHRDNYIWIFFLAIGKCILVLNFSWKIWEWLFYGGHYWAMFNLNYHLKETAYRKIYI